MAVPNGRGGWDLTDADVDEVMAASGFTSPDPELAGSSGMPADEIHVSIELEAELYPVVAIYDIGMPDIPDGVAGYLVPAALFRAYEAAQKEVDRLEHALISHVAERNPEATAFHEWLKDSPFHESSRSGLEVEAPDTP